jgi:predicted nucleotidyltransferase
MLESVATLLASDPRVSCALLFGSAARGTVSPEGDLDVAVGLAAGTRPAAREIGELVSRLESAAGRPVDLVLLDEAPPALAYRIFRDGVVLTARDPAALARAKARAIIEYLDFRPIEELCVRGALAAASRGR